MPCFGGFGSFAGLLTSRISICWGPVPSALRLPWGRRMRRELNPWGVEFRWREGGQPLAKEEEMEKLEMEGLSEIEKI